jgi:hypothetical protein
MSTATPFDFAPLLPAGLPAPAARWTGLAKYSFVGGNNDPDQVPVDGLIDAINAVLRREGKTLATYGLASGPQGYRPLREFLTAKLKRDAGIACGADDIMIVSGSLQALDLVNQTLLARGDTVLVEQETYQGALTRLTRLGVKAVGIPLDDQGMRMDALAAALADHKSRGITPKYIYTIPTVQNPTGSIMPEARRKEMIALARQYGTMIFDYKGRSERVTADTEQDITNAIIKVVSGQQKKVYFTDGHGEKDTTSSERDGYNTIVQALGRVFVSPPGMPTERKIALRSAFIATANDPQFIADAAKAGIDLGPSTGGGLRECSRRLRWLIDRSEPDCPCRRWISKRHLRQSPPNPDCPGH